MAEVEPDVAEHLRGLWAARWWALGAGLLAAVLAFGVRQAAEETYEATAIVRLVAGDPGPLLIDDEQADLLARTYAELAESPAVVGAVEEIAPVAGVAVEDVDIEAAAAETPGFVELTARASSGRLAEQLAQAYAEALVEEVAGDQDPEASGLQVRASVARPAEAGGAPLGPSAPATAAVALIVVSIVVAEGLLVVRRARGRLLIGDPAAEVTALLGVPAVHLHQRSHEAQLRALVPFFVLHLSDAPVVTVAQRGRHASAAGALLIGEVAASVGRRTLVLDTDFTRPAYGDRPGVSELIAGTHDLSQVSLLRPNERLVLMNAGVDPAGGVRALGDGRVRSLVDGLGADVTVVSTTDSDGGLADLLALVQFPHAVVLVCDPGRTTRRALLEAASEIRAGGGGFRGVVLLDHRRSARWRPGRAQPAPTLEHQGSPA